MRKLYFEDFSPGQTIAIERKNPISKEEIVDYARQYDPQPFHLDEEAAKSTMLGGLAASGWHTCALVMRMNFDDWLDRTASMGAPGIDEVRWAKPVRPGDLLMGKVEVLDTRVSRSRPGMGLVAMSTNVGNAAGDLVFTQRHTQLIELREPKPAQASNAKTEERAAPAQAPPAASDGTSETGKPFAGFFEDIVVGASRELGQEAFTKENIVAFAQKYDPQRFHLDEDEARNSHFGRLAASGWQTASLWMKNIIATRDRVVRERKAQGLEVPAMGPSPGFTNLRWIKPVYAGDTVTFATRVVDKRVTSKPDWGLMFSENTGTNQHGERVYEFRGSAFIGMRAAK